MTDPFYPQIFFHSRKKANEAFHILLLSNDDDLYSYFFPMKIINYGPKSVFYNCFLTLNSHSLFM